MLITTFFSAFKRHLRFSLSDYHFGLSIELKDEKSKTSLLKSTMNSLLVALTAILQSLKTRFNDNLDRNLYLTLCHDDLASGVILGPRNLAFDDIDKIAQEMLTKIEHVLESHASLHWNKSLEIFVRVLGKNIAMYVILNSIFC